MSILKANDLIDRDESLVLAGATKYEERLTSGVRATGKILFTTTPTAGHTVTIGNKTLTFRASANADLDEVTIGTGTGTELSETISNLITKLEAYTSGLVTMASYTKTDTNKAITVTAKACSIGYNGATGFPLASSNANGTVTAMSGGVDGWISLNHATTHFTDTNATASRFTLDAGAEGQIKRFLLGARTNAVNVVVDVLPVGGPVATITFSAANQYANVIFLGGKWRSLGGTAAFA